ncbi:MAG: hypothetical protein M3314_10005 [Actinomycetota bacterium]|nr:hypothetical protein [Actinomycetota bacterium]
MLAEIFSRIGTTNRFFVEFGIGRGGEGNTIFLADVVGWAGVYLEAVAEDYAVLERKYRHNERVTTRHALVTPETIEPLLSDAGVPREFDLLSIDIDGNDYWVWEAITSFTPRVVLIEYNSLLDPRSKLVQPYEIESRWDCSEFYGSSLGALRSLAAVKGYFLVHTELTGTNAFFVSDSYRTQFEDVEPVADRSLNYSLQAEGPDQRPSEGPYLRLGEDGD